MSEPVLAFTQYVIKLHSRCNLACDHCYVYEHADQTWRNRPLVIADHIIELTALRIAEHCEAHALAAIRVTFHGGEPLLAGHARIRRMTQIMRDLVPSGCRIDFRLQTNGVLLDEAYCEQFVADGIKVGVSVDGDQMAHDRHRRFRNGQGSYAAVAEATRRLAQPQYRPAFSGLLCTIDVANDPIETYEALLDLDPPQIDFLLPHATWAHPPPRPAPHAPVFGEWLIAVYDRWQRDRDRVRIRLFDSIHLLLAGGGSLTESLGLEPTDMLVIETDGSIEQADSLKTAFHGAASTGYHVSRHRLDELQAHPGLLARAHGVADLCGTCRRCPEVDVCGGGLYAHRYSEADSFLNPSVFCVDLLKLITHVRQRRSLAQAAAATRAVHTMAGKQFDEMAGGRGGLVAIQALVDAERSLRRTLVKAAIRSRITGRADGTAWQEAWDALTELEQIAPNAVRTVLSYPYVRVWASFVLTGEDTVGVTYLWGVVLACAARAGIALTATVPVEDLLPLPTLGALRLPPAAGTPRGRRVARTELEADGRAMTIDGATILLGLTEEQTSPARPEWQPLRFLETPGWQVAIDDLDPLRGCYHYRASDRQTADELAAWQKDLSAAWDIIGRVSPAQRAALAAGLLSITPLDSASSLHASATHRQAFGAVGVSRPNSDAEPGADLARLLLHEFQHLKLGAVLDSFEILDGRDTRRYAVGWRSDPRPLEAVLQGAYAHMAEVEFWRDLALQSLGTEVERAVGAYRSLRDQTTEAVAILDGSDSLTPIGRRWVDGMQSTIGRWVDEPTVAR